MNRVVLGCCILAVALYLQTPCANPSTASPTGFKSGREPSRGVIPSAVAFSPDGKFLLLGYSTRNLPNFRTYLTLWDVQTKKKVRSLKGPKHRVNFISIFADGARAIAASAGTLYLYRLPQGTLIRRIKAYQRGSATTVLSAGGQFALTFGRDHSARITLKLWKLDSGKLVKAIDAGHDSGGLLAMSADNRWALTANYYNTLGSKTRLWDLDRGKPIKSFRGANGWGAPVAFTPDAKLALLTQVKNMGTAAIEGHFVLWNIADGKKVRSLVGEPGEKPTFLAGGKQLVAYSSDHKVKLWEIKTGRIIKLVSVYPGHRQGLKKPDAGDIADTVRAFAFSPKSNLAVAVIGDHFPREHSKITVKVWDLTNSRLLCSWEDRPLQ
jgi:WD40 repeat protein